MTDKFDIDKKNDSAEVNLNELSSPDTISADLQTLDIKTTQETENIKQKFIEPENININERLNSKPKLEQSPELQKSLKNELNTEQKIDQNQQVSQKQNVNLGPKRPTKIKGIPVPSTPYPPTILDRFMNYLAYLLKKLEILLMGFFKKKEPEKVIFHKMNEVLEKTTGKKKKKKKWWQKNQPDK